MCHNLHANIAGELAEREAYRRKATRKSCTKKEGEDDMNKSIDQPNRPALVIEGPTRVHRPDSHKFLCAFCGSPSQALLCFGCHTFDLRRVMDGDCPGGEE